MPEFESKLKRILMAPARFCGAILIWLTKASEKFERGFKKAATRAAKVGDAASTADSVVGRVFKALLSPFRWIGQRVLVPMLGAVNANPFFQSMGRSTYWIWYPFVALGSFIRTFLQTRTRALIGWSLPFVVVVGGTLFMLWSLNPRKNEVSQQYVKAIEELRKKGSKENFEQAALYQRKLQSLGLRTEQSEMRQIFELVEAGKLPQAIDLAESIAPLDKPGYPNAHLWLVGIYLQAKGALTGQASLDRAEQHLFLLESIFRSAEQPLPPDVLFAKAQLEIGRNDMEQGLAQLKSFSDGHFTAKLLQMEIHLRLGNKEEAIKDALAICKFVQDEPSILKEVSPLFYPMWCNTLAQSGDREELRNAVSLWYQNVPDEPSAASSWGGFQFEEIRILMDRASESDTQRASQILIETSNQLGSKYHSLVNNWWSVKTKINEEKSNVKEVQNHLRIEKFAAENPQASGTFLEMLGTAATLRGEHQRALDLLKRATEKDPENAVAWNNLAFVANSHFENETELALAAVDKAAQIQPRNIDILHTRGIIRIKLGQWDSAISDLVAVIAEKPNLADVHLGLAQAYNAIGKTDLAAFHEQRAR